jgi:predicted small metal-binding protein
VRRGVRRSPDPGRRRGGASLQASPLSKDYLRRETAENPYVHPEGFYADNEVVLGCEWVTRSEDEKELFDEIHSHARDVHGMDQVPPEVEDQIHSVITEVPADDRG